jgi:hypothetical protein
MSEVFPTLVYSLCFLTSTTCTAMLVRSYRLSGASLLLWSAVCFGLLAANNLVLVLDLVVWPDSDLTIARLLLSLAAVTSLIWGFTSEIERE